MGRAAGGFGESFRQQSVLKLPLLLREGFMNGNALIERADSDPKRSFERIRMGLRKALGRKAVADLTVELDEFALSSLIKRSIAFRAPNDTASSRKPGFFAWLMLRLFPFSFPFFCDSRIGEWVNFTSSAGISASGTQWSTSTLRKALLGMLASKASRGSCTMAMPPRLLTAKSPADPSSSPREDDANDPPAINPRALRKRGSMAGR